MDPGGLWLAQEPNFWAHGHAPRGTFEIGTQIVPQMLNLLNITPLNALEHLQMLAVILDILVLHAM